MARTVNVTEADVKGSKSTGFDPLPAGKLNVTIFEHEVTQGKNGPNKGRDFLRLQLRVSDGQRGANRRLFTQVGDFPRWAPKGDAAEGKVNFTYYQFYKALGVVFPEGGGDVDLPDLEELDGASLGVKISVEPDKYQYEKALGEWKDAKDKGRATDADEPQPGDFLKNEVKEFFPPLDEDDLAAEASEDEFSL